ncbi:acyl-CoA dehydrogenase [Nocardioides sp. SYSU DS0663]|uniref:acyl-CoA dehydrogenase n=1 Tax=Nocardioides sp. SYSU DS0663 TaxID=3416445 RepID=UPI003F4B6B44
MSLIMSRADLDFLLHEWLGVEELLGRPRYAEHSRETFDAVLDLAETVATRHFATHNKRNDAEEPQFVDGRAVLHPEVAEALEVYASSGFTGATFDEELGGMQLPQVVAAATSAWFQAANCGTAGYPFLTQANAHLLATHGTSEQVDAYVRPMLEGRFFGTMCLSEPQAGSSLADVTTTAVPQPDGTFRLRGTKMWISGGDHEMGENIVHLVLARTEGAPAGTKGISLFLVPKHLLAEDGSVGERNDVVLAGLNHKMGWRGTTNTLLSFGEGAHRPGGEPGAVGHLVGEQHRGLALMFHMMNEARVGVGLGAAALGYTGYLKALDYARTRPQGRLPQAKDPSSPPVPIIEHADVRRMLLTMKAYVEGGLALVLHAARLVDEERTHPDPEEAARAHLLLDTLTPIVKSWPSQWCLAANDLAIQVHGGYGYTREYDVEQHYRDNRLNPIHEGTHGIQGLDLLGRKVVAEGGAGLRLLAERITATTDEAARRGGDLAEDGARLRATVDRLVEVTGRLWSTGDPETALAHSSTYLEVAGHVVVAWLWLQQALVAEGGTSDLHEGKRHAARWFLRTELPRTGPQLDLLERLDRSPLDVPETAF